MGIADRDYVRQGRGGGGSPFGGAGRGGGGRLGRMRVLSVNAWIILINILVFVADVGLSRFGIAMAVGTSIVEPDYAGPVAESQDFFIPVDSGQLRFGPAVGQNLQMTRADDTQRRESGRALIRLLVTSDREQRLVGYRFYRVMHPLEYWGHFSTYQGFFRLEVWRLVTFQFLHSHDNFWHIAFNMFGLFVFGGIVEQFLGSKRYLAFYLMCGIGGGLGYLLLNLIGAVGVPLPGALDVAITTPLIGASAGVFGVIVACAYIAPNTILHLIFPPIPLKLKWLAYGYVGLAAFNLFIARGANQGGDAAHLGGAVAGWYFIRNSHLLRDFFDVFKNSRKGGGGGGGGAGGKRKGDEAEVDRILAKVSAQGLQSLTPAEKRTLSRANRDASEPGPFA